MNPLKDYLSKNKISITRLAKELNIDRAYISFALNGNRTLPKALVDYFNSVNPDLIMQFHKFCIDKHKTAMERLSNEVM